MISVHVYLSWSLFLFLLSESLVILIRSCIKQEGMTRSERKLRVSVILKSHVCCGFSPEHVCIKA